MIADSDSVLVLGSTGLVGSAVRRLLTVEGISHMTTRVDLRDPSACRTLFDDVRPDYVFHCAARVGGIQANDTRRVDFLADNLQIGLNVLQCAHEFDVGKLLNLGSSCIYPRDAEQPMAEEALLTGSLEPTNRPYALAKISIIELCKAYHAQYGRNFISAMPCNLYGPEDNFMLGESHVLPALIRRFIMAKNEGTKTVTLWGDGSPRREFLHVDDLASACLFLIDNWNSPEQVNVGAGVDCTITELAEQIAQIVGYSGDVIYDTNKPNGTPRKLLDVSKMNQLGWRPTFNLHDGLVHTIRWVCDQLERDLPLRGWR